MEITPLILTYNEEPNIARALERLTWAKEIVLVDSCSTDGTCAIASRFKNVRLLERRFDDHTSQWNYGLDQISTEWVLSLDADYVLEPGFEDELAALSPSPTISAYATLFRYCINGKPLRGTLYPPRHVLFRRASCRYEQDGHTQLLKVNGSTGQLRSRILHDDRKPLSHWLQAQDRYAKLEAQKLLVSEGQLSIQDRIRCCAVVAPFLVFFYTLLAKGLIFDGWPGWFYVFQRVLAELMLSLRLLEAKIGKLKSEN